MKKYSYNLILTFVLVILVSMLLICCNVSKTAAYALDTFTVTFDSNGGSSVEPIYAEENTAITAPTAPTLTGYTFGGWYTDDDTFLLAYDFSALVTADFTLYAKWTDNLEIMYNEKASIFETLYNEELNYLNNEEVTEFIVPDDLNDTMPISILTSGDLFALYNFSDANDAIEFYEINLIYWEEISYSLLIQESCVFMGYDYIWELLSNDILLDNDFYYLDKDTYYTIFLYTGQSTTVTVPSSYNNKPVTRLESSAFADNLSLLSITIPNIITTIGKYTFANCSNLSTVTITDSIIYIGSGAFSGTQWLNNQADGMIYVGKAAYCYKGEMPENTTISISSSTVSITEFLFYDQINLIEINLPESLTVIGEMSFEHCLGLTGYNVDSNNLNFASASGVLFNKSNTVLIAYPSGKQDLQYTVPDNVTTINRSAFQYASFLETIVISGGITSINPFTFANCSSLSNINIPANVLVIDYFAFAECNSLTNITIPNTVTEIGIGAFSNSLNLISVNFLSGSLLNKISENMFESCSSLTTINIPDSIICISDYAFSECSGITNLNIPDNVTYIGDYTFSGCSGLTDINLSDDLVYIGDYAFANCNSLITLMIPDSVTNIGESAFISCVNLTTIQFFETGCLLNSINDNLFYGCTSLASIDIPNNVISIGNNAFSSCNSLTYISIPNSVTDIGQNAFEWCTSLDNINLPSGITTIKNATFRYSGISNITISTSLMNIGEEAFGYCNNLISIDIKNVENIADYAFAFSENFSTLYAENVTYIGNHMFDGTAWRDNNANGLVYLGKIAYYYKGYMPINTSIIIDDGTLIIYDDLFSNQTNLINITLADSITNINSGAFQNSSINNIYIPTNVIYIADNAFYNCECIVNINVDIYNSFYSSIDGVLFNKTCSSLIYYPASKTYTSYTIPTSVTIIEELSFYDSHYLTEIIISTNVINIGSYAFADNVYLNTITFVAGSLLENIEYGAFMGTGLVNVAIPSNVTNIGEKAFWHCGNMSLLSFSTGSLLNSIASNAFEGCIALTSLTIPNSVTNMGDYIFAGCNNLISIEFETGSMLSDIGAYAFSNCTALTSISIPSNVVRIGEFIFYECTSLTSISVDINNGYLCSIDNILFNKDGTRLICYPSQKVGSSYTIPDNVTHIDNYAFNKCIYLTNIITTDYIIDIGSSAFTECIALISITIPESITNIRNYTFLGCSSLRSIIIPENITDIGDLTFSGCSSLISVTIPENVINIGDSAFSECTNLVSVTIGAANFGNNTFSGCSSLTSIILLSTATSIGEGAFSGCIGLTSISIPANIINIGDSAFFGCSSLTSVTIPVSVINIGDSAFSECINLANISVAASNIGGSAFSGCTSLETIELLSTVSSINGGAFRGCIGLTSIIIPNNVTYIEKGILDGCDGLISISLPFINYFSYIYEISEDNDNDIEVSITLATSLNSYAFDGCTNLTSINMVNVTNIGDNAFYGCTNLTDVSMVNAINIGYRTFYGCINLTNIYMDNVETIRNFAFANCTNLTTFYAPNVRDTDNGILDNTAWFNNQIDGLIYLGKVAYFYKGAMPEDTSIIINNGIIVIEEGLFINQTNLINITLPDSITHIEANAFQNCGISNITIPANVEIIGYDAFIYCSFLESINVDTNNNYYCSIDGVLFNKDCSVLSLYPANKNNTSYMVPANVITINNNAFLNCYNLETITFDTESLLESIGYCAFMGCSALISIIIPDSVTDIGPQAFSTCTSLISINIPSNVALINIYSFAGCSNLSSIIFGIDSILDSIGDKAFEGCIALTSIALPEHVTNIGDLIFYGCTNLNSISVDINNNNYCSIDDVLFSKDGTRLICYPSKKTGNSYTISDNVIYIDSYAFNNCIYLTNIATTNYIVYIGNSAFMECTALINITIPSNITNIGINTFSGCSSLTSIIIPTGVTFIGDSAFSGCISLASITIPESVYSIGNSAFYNTLWLTNQADGIVYAGKVAYIYKGTMPSDTNLVIANDTIAIADSAFYNQSNIISVTLPSSLIFINNYAFSYCYNLRTVNVLRSMIADGSITQGTNNVFENCGSLNQINIPTDSYDDFIAVYPWKSYISLLNINYYTAIFDVQGGSNVEEQIISLNSPVIQPTDPIKDNYSFAGWYTDVALTTIYDFSTLVTADITLYAKWSKAISFESNGGSIVNPIMQDEGTTVTAPTAPTKTGYTFDGWYSDIALTAPYTFSIMPAENIIIYAKWTINQYMISFECNGGSTISSISQNYNTNVSAPTDPTKTGYTFDGWYSDIALTAPYTFSTMPAENITLYAKWL